MNDRKENIEMQNPSIAYGFSGLHGFTFLKIIRLYPANLCHKNFVATINRGISLW